MHIERHSSLLFNLSCNEMHGGTHIGDKCNVKIQRPKFGLYTEDAEVAN